jgi:hypothetical protein
MTKRREPKFKTRKARKQKMALRGNTMYTHRGFSMRQDPTGMVKAIADFAKLMHRSGDR